ncbi:Sus1 protein [Martiniozyma asiatica (nom. inval.)]|nr:Sus1 protein [Martiniozyma asiatica]
MADLHARIQQELVSSGKYKEIYNLLETELRNSGWYDNFQSMTQNAVETSTDQDLKFGILLSSLQGKGMQSVPDEVKIKVMKKIAEFLDDVVE